VSFTAIDSDGPLTHISIANDLSCQVRHSGDAQAEFYPSVDFDLAACGTQIAVGGTVYGPADVTGGNNPVDYTPVSQSPVTGTGTATDPYTIVTVVTAGPVQLTETDTYVEGKEEYGTTLALKNTSTTTAFPIVVYRFGDCYLHEDDTGYGRVTGSSVSCTTDTTADAGTLTWKPVTAGSRYYEGDYPGLYNAISSASVLPNTCDCTTQEENAAGLSWSTTLARNAAKTYASTTKLSPQGPKAVVTTASVIKNEVLNATTVTYTLTYQNPTPSPVTLTEMTDHLPTGFSYVNGSSSGQTTADPAIDGTTNTLTWSGSFTIPAGGKVMQKFRAVATGSAGPLRYNRAGGTADIRVAPTGLAAPLRICTVVDPAGGHTITGTTGNDVICAGDGDDTVNALDGDDTVIGGKGNDQINLGPGNDYAEGGTENDTIDGGTGSDVFLGGNGSDTVFYGPSVSAALTINLNDNGDGDGAAGEKDDIRPDIENAVGGAGADAITGNGLANLLQGGSGADLIAGKAGADTLRGGSNYDTLTGNDDGSAADSLDCEADRGLAHAGPNDTVANCD
jgi:uncharacterized repeat protein (TIGR01451 family)